MQATISILCKPTTLVRLQHSYNLNMALISLSIAGSCVFIRPLSQLHEPKKSSDLDIGSVISVLWTAIR